MNKNTFLYNPKKSKNNYDVYSNNNPSDTIPIKYTTIDDVKNTIIKLEKLYKTDKYPHKRISQVAMIMKVRLEIFKKNKNKRITLQNIINLIDKNPKLKSINNKYPRNIVIS